MREQVIKTVETYIEVVRRNDEASLPLDLEIAFEGPLATVRGLEEFHQGLLRFIPTLKSIKRVRLTAEDETCAAVLELDTIYGIIPFIEYFYMRHGMIYKIRAYFDPRPILEGRSGNSLKGTRGCFDSLHFVPIAQHDSELKLGCNIPAPKIRTQRHRRIGA